VSNVYKDRSRTLALLVTVLSSDIAMIFLRHSSFQGVGAVFALLSGVSTLGVIVSALLSEGDRPVRGAILLSIVAYTGYKLWTMVEFARHG
jgi:hypothetical protein